MLNDQQIKHRAEREKLITPYDDKFLQPHSYDATLHSDIKVAHYDVIDKVKTWKAHNCYITDFELQPGQFALASTREYFKMPQGLVGFVQGKSSIGRNGLQIENAGLIDAGFEGAITLEFYNMAPWPIILKAGMPICQIHFTSVQSPVYKDYHKIGHYNGQRGPTNAVYAI